MDKVTILSREKFLAYQPEVPKEEVVAIRIADTVPPIEDTATKRYHDSMSLAFYDLPLYADETDRSHGIESLRLREKDKKEIDDYIDRYADKTFVLHCEEGKSRSAAIGYYILKRLGYTKELNRKKEMGIYSPNIEVYGLLTGKPYTRKTGIELREEIDNPE